MSSATFLEQSFDDAVAILEHLARDVSAWSPPDFEGPDELGAKILRTAAQMLALGVVLGPPGRRAAIERLERTAATLEARSGTLQT